MATTEQSSSQENSANEEHPKKEIRIFMDGAFDLMHFGHMNAFRLAKSLGNYLVVGVNSDRSITECKGAPLMNDEERLAMVQSCKFVDQVIQDCPYVMNQEYLEWVVKEHKIDYVVHGDDPCIVDGKDVYATAKEAGRFQTIPRTEGVSTTDIVGRILLLTKKNSQPQDDILGTHSKFLTTTSFLTLFSSPTTAPTANMRVIYIDGAWDLFHPGHAAILKAAKEVRSRGLISVPPVEIRHQHSLSCQCSPLNSVVTILLLVFTAMPLFTSDEGRMRLYLIFRNEFSAFWGVAMSMTS